MFRLGLPSQAEIEGGVKAGAVGFNPEGLGGVEFCGTGAAAVDRPGGLNMAVLGTADG